VLDKLDARTTLALTSKSFRYTRSDSFGPGKREQLSDISILEFDPRGGFSIRYNDYRFSVMPMAGAMVEDAFMAFKSQVKASTPLTIGLKRSSAVLINNARALHCREPINDNRRLLVRLFGYSQFAQPVVLNEDPLLVKG
jgi:hypothetical protein